MRNLLSNYPPELLKGITDFVLLSMIKKQPMYGYQIIKEIERRTNGYLQFKEGTIYPALYRLEEDGLITGRWEEVPGTSKRKQKRRYYYITKKGEKALADRLSVWRSFTRAISIITEPAGV